MLTTTTIGRIAQQVFSGAREASIWGLTSRGIFLHLQSDWMVFLSGEPYRGPLTVNLAGDMQQLFSLKPGSPVRLRDGIFIFKTLGLEVRWGESLPWEPPVPDGVGLSPEELEHGLLAVVRRVWMGQKGRSRAGFLRNVLEYASCTGNPTSETAANPEIADLVQAFRIDEPAALGNALAAFIGKGQGLTPSGDDLVAGLLLAVNRWGAQLFPGQELRLGRLNRAAIQVAHRNTTTLSANLIECAALGQADERLVVSLDGIMTGKPEPAVSADLLLGWGSSSGSDALAGMILAIKCLPMR